MKKNIGATFAWYGFCVTADQVGDCGRMNA